jgi:hypothetical protein
MSDHVPLSLLPVLLQHTCCRRIKPHFIVGLGIKQHFGWGASYLSRNVLVYLVADTILLGFTSVLPGLAQAQRSLGFGMRVGSGMKWEANGILWAAWCDAGGNIPEERVHQYL